MEGDAFDFDPPFVGREEELRKFIAAWQRHAIFGIFGVRAVGKSRFVKEFLDRNGPGLSLSTNIKVIKVNLKMFETTIETFIHLIYSSLGIMPDNDAINNGKWKEHIASAVLKKLTDLHVLTLWFDNAEDALDLDTQVHDQLLSLCVMLVQHCIGIKIIITSTTKFLFTQIRRAYFQLELNPLAKSEVIQLLEQVSPAVEFGDFAEPIAEQCEGLPLLVTMTASELSEDGGLVNPEEMFELLLENKLRVLSREYYPEEDRIADVYSKFLQRLPEALQRRLATLNYIPGSFNASEATEILGYDKVSTVKDQALIPIRRRYYLNFDSQSGRFNIQGILRNCMDSYLKWANIPVVRKRYCKVFTKVMKDVCEEMGTVEYASALTRFSAEQPNFQKLLTEVLLCEEETYRYFIEVAGSCSLLLERFFSKESERFYKGCLQIAKTYGNTRDLACVSIAFGSLYTNVRGEFLEGEGRYRQAMDILNSLGDSRELALANQRMGWSLYRQGRHSESLSFLEAARKIIKSLGLENTSLTVKNLTSLGVVNNAMGNFERAKNFHFKTLKIRRKTQGESHPAIGASYNNIGLIYNEMGNPEQALAYFKKGLEVKIKSQAILKSVVYSMNNIANQLCSLKKFHEAETMLQDALHKLQDDANPSRDALSLTYDTLGKVYLAQMKYAKADEVLEKAVEIRQEIMPNGIAFAESLMHLAQAKIGSNHFGSARVFIDRVLELQAKCIEDMPQNTIILESLELLSSICCAQQNLDKRIEVLERQRDELTRLLAFFETQKCMSKLEEMQRKHDECQRLLNVLRCNLPDSSKNQMTSKDQDRNTRSNISGAAKTAEGLESTKVTKMTKCFEDKSDLSNQGKDPVQIYDQADEYESVRSNVLQDSKKAQMSLINQNRLTQSNISGVVKTAEISERHEVTEKTQDLYDIKDPGNEGEDSVQTIARANEYESVQSNSKDFASNSKSQTEDFFGNFCRHWNYNQNQDNAPKNTGIKVIDTIQSTSDNSDATASFCTQCGRDSFTDNNCIEHEQHDTKKETEGIENSCVIPDDNELEEAVSNIPDLTSLLEGEGGQTSDDHGQFKIEGCCRNNLDKESKESRLACLCAYCLDGPVVCRNTS